MGDVKNTGNFSDEENAENACLTPHAGGLPGCFRYVAVFLFKFLPFEGTFCDSHEGGGVKKN